MQPIHLLAASLAIAAATPLMAERAPCADYVLIQARGTDADHPEPRPERAFEFVVAWTLGNVTNGENYNVNYTADNSQEMADEGADDAIRFINAQRAVCPEQRYGLLGYSQGATVMAYLLQKIVGTDIGESIDALITFGNPYQKAGQPITIDENAGTSTRDFDGLFLPQNPSLAFSQEWIDSGKIQQTCFFRDQICAALQAFWLPIISTHTSYTGNQVVQGRAAQFLISKLRR